MKSFTKIVLCSTLFFSPSIFAQEDDSGLVGVLASATAKRVAGVVSLITALGLDALSNQFSYQSGRHEELEKQEREKKPVENAQSWSHYSHKEKESKSSGYVLGSWACWFGAKAGYLASVLFFGAAYTQRLRENVDTLEKHKGMLEVLVESKKEQLNLTTVPNISSEGSAPQLYLKDGELIYPV